MDHTTVMKGAERKPMSQNRGGLDVQSSITSIYRNCLMKTLILLTSLALLITTGCRAARLSESFQPSPPISSEPYLEMLGVTTAREGRPLGGRSRIGPGFLVFIPLFPYGPQQFTPERFWSN